MTAGNNVVQLRRRGAVRTSRALADFATSREGTGNDESGRMPLSPIHGTFPGSPGS